MAEYPALPLWTDAYLADCGYLSDAEHGRYLLLLMAMWRSPDCRLPNDDQWLARKFRRPVEDIQSQFRPLIIEFCDCTGNWIIQKRLMRERDRVKQSSIKQSERAKSRWNKDKVLCRGNAGVAKQPYPYPEPNISPSFSSDSDFDSWWQLVPKRVGKGQAMKAFRSALRKTDIATLTQGIKAYAAAVEGKDPQFVCHPATWLNGERWMDQDISLCDDDARTRQFDKGLAEAKAKGPEAIQAFLAQHRGAAQ